MIDCVAFLFVFVSHCVLNKVEIGFDWKHMNVLESNSIHHKKTQIISNLTVSAKKFVNVWIYHYVTLSIVHWESLKNLDHKTQSWKQKFLFAALHENVGQK